MFKKGIDRMGQGEDANLPVPPPFKPVPFPSDPAARPSGSVMVQRSDSVGDLPSGYAAGTAIMTRDVREGTWKLIFCSPPFLPGGAEPAMHFPGPHTYLNLVSFSATH